MYEVEYIPLDWVERAAFWPGLAVYSRPITIERRVTTRRTDDNVARLLKAFWETANG